jgi:hypothetical protein
MSRRPRGSAPPSSAHTRPSASASSAPTIQPKIACGPPNAAIISGIVTNGPIPHIWVMLIATAERSPIVRSKPSSCTATASLLPGDAPRQPSSAGP